MCIYTDIYNNIYIHNIEYMYIYNKYDIIYNIYYYIYYYM